MIIQKGHKPWPVQVEAVKSECVLECYYDHVLQCCGSCFRTLEEIAEAGRLKGKASMSKIEIDRQVLLDTWNKAYEVVQNFHNNPFQRTPEYYYNVAVCDTLKLLWDKVDANKRQD